MAKKARKVTWADIGLRNAGFMETARALRFCMSWGLATASLGHEPETVEEYAGEMEVSRAKAFRDQQAFRSAFPTENTPARMNRQTGAQNRYNEAYRQLKDVGAANRDIQAFAFTLGAMEADVDG